MQKLSIHRPRPLAIRSASVFSVSVSIYLSLSRFLSLPHSLLYGLACPRQKTLTVISWVSAGTEAGWRGRACWGIWILFFWGCWWVGLGIWFWSGCSLSRLFWEWFIWVHLFSANCMWDEMKVLLILCSWDIYRNWKWFIEYLCCVAVDEWDWVFGFGHRLRHWFGECIYWNCLYEIIWTVLLLLVNCM